MLVANAHSVERGAPSCKGACSVFLLFFPHSHVFVCLCVCVAILASGSFGQVSTLCSSIFLLFCTVTVFGKLGAVVMAVTILSLYFALVPLPALLMLVGRAPALPVQRLACISRVTGRDTERQREKAGMETARLAVVLAALPSLRVVVKVAAGGERGSSAC